MNWVDGGIVLCLLIGARRGLYRGLGQESFQLMGAIGGVVSAYAWGEATARSLAGRFWVPGWLAKPVALVGLALGLTLCGHVLGMGWNRWVERSSLRTWDRWAGAAIGMLQASLITGMFLFIWIEWPGRPFPVAVEGSYLARSLLAALPTVYRNLEWVLAPLR